MLIADKGDGDARRWVYLDVGKFDGLAETMDESIQYRDRDARPRRAAAGHPRRPDLRQRRHPLRADRIPAAARPRGRRQGRDPVDRRLHRELRLGRRSTASSRCSPTASEPAGSRRRRRCSRSPTSCRRTRAAVEGLLDEAFGPARRHKTCERLRERRSPLRGLSLLAAAGGRLIGSVRLWPVLIGRTRALLLGPLAVRARARCSGIGARLMRESLARARTEGHDAVILVGDEPYYRQFGFVPDLTRRMLLPGAVDRRRFLGLELTAARSPAPRGLVQAA